MSYNQENIKPYSRKGEKSEQVEAMFDGIAPTYDFLNHALSLGIDKGWRTKAVKALGQHCPRRVLDVATGTGDFAILTARLLHPAEIVGVDISEGMMEVARRKVAEQAEALRGTQITFRKEDCLNLGFPDASFDAVTVAYGVRNFQDLDAGLAEMYRVLRAGGHLLIVELATPPRFPMRQLFLALFACHHAPGRPPRQWRQPCLHLSACHNGGLLSGRSDGRHFAQGRLFRRTMASLHLWHLHDVPGGKVGRCPPSSLVWCI